MPPSRARRQARSGSAEAISRAPAAAARWLGVATFVYALAFGCGASQAPTDDEAREEGEAPPTDRDPPTHTPRPTADARTGEIASVATAGGYDQAKNVVMRFVLAVRDADETSLTALLADPLGRAQPRISAPNRQRSAVIRQIVTTPQRTNLGPEVPLDALIDASTLDVVPLSRHQAGRTVPPGFMGTDLVVTFALAAQGRQHFRVLLGWPPQTMVVVRPGSEPQILAL